MDRIKIDADALFRAVTALEHKVLAYYLDLRTGEVVARTLMPGEVNEPPPGPRVKPLPKLGGELGRREQSAPFGPPPVAKKVDLFKDDVPKPASAFQGGFWKREEHRAVNPFGGEGPRHESGARKLAQLFGEPPPAKEAGSASPAPPPAASPRPPAQPGPASLPVPPAPSPAAAAAVPTAQPAAPIAEDAGRLQRIPPASAEQNMDWYQAFARDCGDPQIREQLQRALAGSRPRQAFERTLRNYQRLEQQWQLYYRRQILHYAEVWLHGLAVQYEIVEPPRGA
jgi:hypothetical protein